MAKNVSIFDGSAWVSIVGPAGKDGVDGKDGSGVDIKGTANAYPPDAAPTAGDMWIVADPVPAGFPPGTNPGDGLVWSGTAWNNVGGIRGPAGKDGADGAAGAAGKDGADGAPGVDGAAGADGAPGDPGQGFRFRGEWDIDEIYENYDVVTGGGQTFLIQGLTKTGAKNSDPSNLVLIASKGVDGATGADGASGSAGEKGEPGADGRSVNVTKSPTQPGTAAIGDFWIEE